MEGRSRALAACSTTIFARSGVSEKLSEGASGVPQHPGRGQKYGVRSQSPLALHWIGDMDAAQSY